jgi:hypothetical protein
MKKALITGIACQDGVLPKSVAVQWMSKEVLECK